MPPIPQPPVPQPTARRLRVYAFDPNAALDLDTAHIASATISLVWNDPTEAMIAPGPVNEYLEVIDIDPCSRQFYPPLDLNAPEVLGQDGLPPSEGDPRFHQQMVFAVAMKTIKQFERALGRKVLWAPVWNAATQSYDPVPRLRIYPHALREQNAYYSREKRALLFGYFPAARRSAGASWIFTALSHDIIVHETTHAILDGLHPRYAENTSPDSLAFHEAFADIAALFSHFQLTEAVQSFIAHNAGKLDVSGLLSGLAAQFAKGTSGHASLRDFIDAKPDLDYLENTTEPHERGAILVAAVFDAFLTIYGARTGDLLRMTGSDLGDGRHLHPDLVARLTQEASKAADHVLRMCIRALDYLPPVDVRFGEFLRAIVTADTDLIPDDTLHYRLAFVQAFRRRGIFPENCLSMSPDNLLWEAQPQPGQAGAFDIGDIQDQGLDLLPHYKRKEIVETSEDNRRKVWYWLIYPHLELKKSGDPEKDEADAPRFAEIRKRVRSALAAGSLDDAAALDVMRDTFAEDLAWLGLDPATIAALPGRLRAQPSHIARWNTLVGTLTAPGTNVTAKSSVDGRWERTLGLFNVRPKDTPLYTIEGDDERLKVEVASVRTTRRSGPDGQDIRQLVIEVTQRRQGWIDPAKQREMDATPSADGRPPRGDFVFRGGATMIVDLHTDTLRYVIRKAIDDDDRLQRQRDQLAEGDAMGFTYDRGSSNEPFAMLHRM